MTGVKNQSEVKGTGLWAAIVLLMGGIGVATYQTIIKLRLQNDPSFKSSCNQGEAFNCDAVMTSSWSEVGGIPISLFAIPIYLVMIFLAYRGISGQPKPGKMRGREQGITALRYLTLLGLASCLYSTFLFYISAVVLKTFCIYCVALYVVNFLTTGLVVWASPEKPGQLIAKGLESVLTIKEPMVNSLLIFFLVTGVTFTVYSDKRGEMAGDRFDDIDELFADEEYEEVGEDEAPAEETAEVQAAPAAAQGTAAARKAAGPAKKVRSLSKGKKPKPKMTENGLSFYEAELYSDDWIKGPEDAPVTIVKFADFECSYCRYMDLNVRPLVKKYEGKIRWVMKHYPMNGDCNFRMGSERMHEHACTSATASHCAGEQGKFWEMHDLLYDNQQDLGEESYAAHAKSLELNMEQWSACRRSGETREKIRRDVKIAAKAGIKGTPRAYVNGRLVSGAGSTQIIEYYIKKAMEEAEAAPAAGAQVAEAAGPPAPESASTMAQSATAGGSFFIDAFEGTISANGKAVSQPGVVPAQASWFDAKAACEKSGKRLCTEEEWVSACTGKPAIDNNNNGFFADDDVEGRMYPYGFFYEKGACQDAEDEYAGRATKTASRKDCTTPEGIWDMAGNLQEWVGSEVKDAALVGGDWRGGEGSRCNRRTKTFGPGQRNDTIGFRCCSDQKVDGGKVAEASLKANSSAKVGEPLPQISLDTMDGKKWSTSMAKGKVTYLTFFASWCGSCKRELPELNSWQKAFKKAGFEVVAVGVDRNSAQSEKFAKQFDPVYPVALDPDAMTMGLFNINAMPTSFLVDRKGIIRHREVGFKKDEVALLQRRIQKVLEEK